MSRFRIIFYLLFVVIFLALITAPHHDQFNKYLYKNGKFAGACLGGTRHISYTIFSVDYIDYCEQDANDSSLILTASKKMHTDKYLGLFGRFWKL